MTKNASFKKAVREHMARTGLTYCQARKALLDEQRRVTERLDAVMQETRR